MILADKIINERKKNGWSQEELAGKLSVSRQSVSKWEGAQAVPDIQKIIAMAEIFGVSTDYLLKDEMEPESPLKAADIVVESVKSEPYLRKVSMEEANEYLNMVRKVSPKRANAVSLCILSPIVLIFLMGCVEYKVWNITEDMAAGIGSCVLLVFVAVAVYKFIAYNTESYEYLNYEAIDTEYGVTGMVRARKEAYKEKHNRFVALGVVLCVLSCMPLLIFSFLENSEWEFMLTFMTCLLLMIVSLGVNILLRTNAISESYDKLLEENDYTVEKKKNAKRLERIGAIFWCIVTAVYLGWSLYTKQWGFTWIVWPVAAVLFAAVMAVTKMICKVSD